VPTSYPGNTRLIYGAIQSAKGTPASAPTIVFRLRDQAAMDPGRVIIQLPETDGSSQQSPNSVVGSSPAGGFGTWMRSSEFDWLAQCCLGADADSGSADPWTHTATPTQAMPYVTFWDVIPGVQCTRYDDCRVGTLGAAGTALQGIDVTVANIVALSSTLGVTEPTAPSAPASDEAMSYAMVQATIGGSRPFTVDGWTININRNVTVLHGDNGLGAYDSVPGIFAVDGTLRKIYVSDADYRKFHGGSSSATTLTSTIFAEALDLLIQASASRSVRFTSAAMEYTAATVPVNVDGTPIIQEQTFQTQRQAAIASNLTVVTKNAKATPATVAA
jgi:hypothetical protein